MTAPTRPPATRVSATAAAYLDEHLLDRRHGGVYPAVDVTGHQPLGTAKRLVDQSAAVLALADRAPDGFAVALRGLCGMLDADGYPGFTERTDHRLRPVDPGGRRTMRYQLHAATALLLAATRLDSDALRVRAVDLLNRCLSVVGAAPAGQPLPEDSPGRPRTAVAAVRAIALADAVGEPDIDGSPLPALATVLAAARQAVEPARAAELAIALAHVGDLLGVAEPRGMARTVLGAADPSVPGFRTADTATLLLAAALAGSWELPTVRAAREALCAAEDPEYGGFHHVPRPGAQPKTTHAHAALARLRAIGY